MRACMCVRVVCVHCACARLARVSVCMFVPYVRVCPFVCLPCKCVCQFVCLCPSCACVRLCVCALRSAPPQQPRLTKLDDVPLT